MDMTKKKRRRIRRTVACSKANKSDSIGFCCSHISHPLNPLKTHAVFVRTGYETVKRTFQGRRLVDGKVPVPDDGEIHRQVPHLVTFIPVLRMINRHNIDAT